MKANGNVAVEGERGGPFVGQSSLVDSKKLCVLAHDVSNKLGVIAGNCELVLEHAEADSECARRLRLILETVHSLAKRINGHECRMVSYFGTGVVAQAKPVSLNK